MERLKKCPFCGSEAELYSYEVEREIYDSDTLGYVDTEYFTKYGVSCTGCNCLMAEYKSEEKAIKAWNTRKPMEWYEELERELQSVYGECDGLLETVVDGVVERLIKHEGVQFEKLNKAYLLTDENVDKWNRLKGAMERIVERLEDNSFWTEPTYDMDRHSNEDETEVINLQKAIEIVKEEM